jgi:hypothetical protein
LPAPNGYRSASGAPGPLYWQQRVDYDITATLDTATHTVRGVERIAYTNNSPDTLRYLWFQLDQNLGAPDNPLALVSQAYHPVAGYVWGFRPESTFVGGYTIERVTLLRPTPTGERGRPAAPLPYFINATLMRVMLEQPLPPRATVHLEVGWHFQVPRYWRTGRQPFPDGWLYQVGHWFPRLAVYDDVRGWNTDQFLGHSEFYLEYGDIDYTLTVPASYTVTGTGMLVNADAILPPEQRRRLAVAMRSDTTVHIIAPDEVGKPALLPAGTGATRTWRFRAEQVRDVAWAAAPNFLWDATSWDGVLIQALYPPPALPAWAGAAEAGRFVIREFSRRLIRYPYPTAIDVAGPARGMEYPMIVFNWWRADARGIFNGSMHELGHQWFPMVVGSNERLYGWMDEGLDNFLNLLVWRSRFPGDTTWGGWLSGEGWVTGLRRTGGPEAIMMTPQDRDPNAAFLAHYIKPAAALHFLRSEVVDSSAFDDALREYARRWAFKHPTPADFFRTINEVLGEDLSWFWRSWFFRTDHLDFAIDSVTQRDSAGVTITDVYLARLAEMVAPVELRIFGADGSSRRVKLPVQVWYRGATYVFQLPSSPSARPIRIEIDPRRAYPDVDRSNDIWRIRR